MLRAAIHTLPVLDERTGLTLSSAHGADCVPVTFGVIISGAHSDENPGVKNLLAEKSSGSNRSSGHGLATKYLPRLAAQLLNPFLKAFPLSSDILLEFALLLLDFSLSVDRGSEEASNSAALTGLEALLY